MIKHIDFEPKVLKKGGIFKTEKVEGFQEIVKDVNAWLAEHKPKVLNIETLLLPNIFDPDEEGSEDTQLGTGRSTSTSWYQVVRVWYRLA